MTLISPQKQIFKICLIISGFFICFYNSCQYSPTGTNPVKIEKPSSTNLDVLLTDQQDTIRVGGNPVIIRYQIQTAGKSIVQINVFFDDSLLKSFDDKIDSLNMPLISFNSTQYPDGNHRFSIETIFKAGTGSLADHFGAELLSVKRQWLMQIDNTPPTPLPITSIRRENGRLVVQFERYNHPNFQYYLIKWNANGRSMQMTYYDQNVTTFVDDAYTGGPYSCSVTVFAGNQSATSSRSFDSPFPSLFRVEQTPDWNIRVIWTRCLFDANFRGYYLQKNVDGQDSEVILVNNIDDTSYVDKDEIFGGAIRYTITDGSVDVYRYSSIWAQRGLSIPGFNAAYFHRPTNQLVIKTADAIYSMNPEISSPALTLKKRIDERYDGFSLSVNGRSAYSLLEGTIYRINVESFEIEDSFRISADLPIYKFFACDSGRVLIVRDIQLNLDPALLPVELVDMDNKVILRRYRSPYNGSTGALRSTFASESGGYLFMGDHIYRVGEDYLKAIGQSPFRARFGVGRNGQEYALVSFNDRIEIRPLPDLTILRSFPVNMELSYPFMDPSTGLIAYCIRQDNGYQYVIADPESGEIRFQRGIASSGMEFLRFFGNLVFSFNGGYYMPLIAG
jgi:hypothetical protein